MTSQDVIAARQIIQREVFIADPIKRALVDFADETRQSNLSLQGVSTRSLVLAMPAMQVRAAMNNRNFVNSEDLQVLSEPLFAHRLMMAPGAGDAENVVAECFVRPMEKLSKATVRR